MKNGFKLNKNRLKYTISLVITIIGLLSLFVGTSYALLRGIDTSNNEQVIKAGSVEIKLTEKFENIDKKITVMSDIDGLTQDTTYDFNLKNIGSQPAKFDIKLVNEAPSSYTGEVLDLDYFKVGLEINGEEHGPISLEDVKSVIDSDVIYKGEIINYKMRIWLDEEKSNELKEMEDYKAFLKLEVEVEQRIEEMDKGVEVTTYSYTGDVQEYEVMRDGHYKIEAWGAQGGNSYNDSDELYSGGKGGYSKGEIYLEAGEKLYIYVGGAGKRCVCSSSQTCCGSNGGYNGGGKSMQYTGGSTYYGSGGGATDIRLVKGAWDNPASLASRIMVAGGGGGASNWKTTSYNYLGGPSGGLTGIMGTMKIAYSSTFTCAGGNQTSGGTGSHSTGSGFGIGGNASSRYGPGGGSGYYGGGSSETFSCGGSSYISGHTGCVAVTSQESITPKSGCTTGTTNNNCSIHYSNKKFTNTVMIDGSGYSWTNVKGVNKKMPDPKSLTDNYSAGTGHAGNGYARITYLNYEKEKEFLYTGDVQEYKVPKSGYYYIEMAGAQGGTTPTNYAGGLGAKTSGYVYLNANEKLYFYVGGAGTSGTAAVIATYPGGYNGGGNGYVSRASYTQTAASGGGATDVRLVGGSWNDSASLISRIMVAAGGGGAYTEYVSTSDTAYVYGGDGGTLYGETPIYQSYAGYSSLNPKGGTQTTGGQGLDAWTATSYVNNYLGTFGMGATGGNSYSGGGGGYYGGASGVWQPGAGGSSFISGYAGVDSVKDNTTITHTGQTLHYSGKYFIGGKMLAGNNEGNGYAKIKYVGAKPKRQDEKLDDVRYIKHCVNYNTRNDQNHWVELQAIKDGVNIAKGKTVIGTTANHTSYPYTRIVDGDINADVYGVPSTYSTNQCVTVDLESTYNLDEIAVWNYFGDQRSYYDNITYVSNDNKTWTTIINDATLETSNGHRINAYNDTYNGYIDNGLILWYDGYANTGTTRTHNTTTWKDLSGNNNDGTRTGGTWYNKYLYFDGTDDYVQSSKAIGLSGDANLTMCTVASWQGSTWKSDYPSYMGITANSSYAGLSMTLYSGKPAIDFWNYRYQANNPLEVKKNYQICLVKTSGSINDTSKIYVNAKEVAGTGNSTSSPNITNSAAVIGRLDSTRWANANIYSARFYNKALTEEELLHNFKYDNERFNLE